MQYEFKQSDLQAFLSAVRTPTRDHGNEIQFKYCPYCKGGKSNDPWTAAINKSTGLFNCKRGTCGISANMVTLSKDFGFSLGHDYDTYHGREQKQYRKLKQPQKPIEPKEKALAYLASRGISKDTAARYQVTVQNEKPDILCFPFYNDKGILEFIKYRNILPNTPGAKEWCEANCKPILFGMYQCNTANKTLVMTEGQIDSLSVAEAGIENAVSVPTGKNGFTWYPYCYDWLQRFEKLVIFGDNEKGKITLLDDMRKRFQGELFAVRQQDYKGCKDANEILQKYGKEAIKAAVEQAELEPVNRIMELADVENVNLEELERIPTGIEDIDKILSGGIYLGQVVIVTGKRGSGKSTLTSQFVANALDLGYKTLAYSGELQNYHFKNWIDKQLAGKHNLEEVESRQAGTYYRIPKDTAAMISEWYRGKAFIYDQSSINDDEVASLLDIIEKAIRQYGITFVLLDNLMTMIDIDAGADIYRAQSKFVEKLVKIAKQLNVAIILVAHPRKNTAGTDDNDEIAGSSDITNRVDIVMTYKRPKDVPPNEGRLSISKNRFTGRLAVGKGEIQLFYDTASKRISDNMSDLERQYGWEKDRFVTVSDAELEELPFV